MFFVKNKRRLALLSIDFAIIVAVYLLTATVSLLLESATMLQFQVYAINFGIFALCILASRAILRCYSSIWRYANSISFLKLVISDFIGGCIAVGITKLTVMSIGTWKECAFVSMLNILTLVSRFVYQYKYRRQNLEDSNTNNSDKIHVAIVGAGQIGALLAEELLFDKNSQYTPVMFVENDKSKVGNMLHGIRIFGENEAVLDNIRELKVKEVLIAISDIDDDRLKGFYDFYSRTGCKVKIYDFPIKPDGTDDKTSKRVVREVRIEDLLFRDMLNVVDEESAAYYRNKTVLVTGGGGSIGSELCRQIAKCAPKKLIILDIYENNAYDIQQELLRLYGSEISLEVEIASVRDRVRLDAIFDYYRPEIIFHAAAHKHVPLMEHSNCEAIKNNVFGTYNTADMAEKYGAEKFILISTDKAVNPTNVMGASKRLCEMVIQSRQDSKTVFAAVRFGNVLGSNGSVIPLFKRQIENGGPVTITDKRIIRYFMTIPEASGLVMQAGAMARLGELFVLDMGKPIKILDLALNMIKLSGFNPYIDIDVVETGLRPGEKLYEELLIKTENLDKTANNLIFIERDHPISREAMEKKLEILRNVVESEEHKIASPKITEVMKETVPTFHSPEEVNKNASDSDEMKLVAAK